MGFGKPDGGYPWPWSVCPWIAGRNPGPGEADDALAGDLADFVRTLHEIDTFGLRYALYLSHPARRRRRDLAPRPLVALPTTFT